MSLSREAEIIQLLCEVIREVQEMSGERGQPIDENTCPLTDLAGFDSLRGVEVTVYLQAKLNAALKSHAGKANIFVSSDGRKALTVSEIAKVIVTQAS